MFPARQSAEVPSVNPVVLLADWTQVRFDLRKPVHDEMTPTMYMMNHHLIAPASSAMHLQEPTVDSEWGITNEGLRKEIERAAKKRIESDSDVRLMRIDWLGSDTVFAGLQRMEEFQEELLLPSAEPCAETWVV
ncbi:hypothetical protein FB451DRAFT_1476852 [Mycena latifolia]|nr:hypothetical protein FB451DRAFT_1476852 [Mycena latifolia]